MNSMKELEMRQMLSEKRLKTSMNSIPIQRGKNSKGWNTSEKLLMRLFSPFIRTESLVTKNPVTERLVTESLLMRNLVIESLVTMISIKIYFYMFNQQAHLIP